MKFKSLIIGLVTPLVMLGLVSCGGDGTSSTQEGNPNGNIKFSVANGVSQDFTSVSITTDSSNTNLYSGPFSCPSANTCSLTIAANTKEGYTVLFYNADGDLVGAWTSSSPPASFTSINASATNLGAYLFAQLDKANPQDTYSTLVDVSNYFSKSNAAAIAQGQIPNFFLNLKMHSDTYFAASGAQSATGYYQQLQDSLDKGEVYATPLSNPSASPVKSKIIVAASPVVAAAPPPNCSGLVGGPIKSAASVADKIFSFIPIPGISTVASALNTILANGCDNTFNQLNEVLKQLGDISNALSALQLGQVNLQSSIDSLTNLTAKNIINTNNGNILAAIDLVKNNVNQYNAVLNSLSPPAVDLKDYFARTGGLDAASLQNGGDPKKSAQQNAAVTLLNSLSSQKANFSALGLTTNFNGLSDGLNQLCSSAGIAIAQGDLMQIRNTCNGIIINLTAQVSSYQKAAAIMLVDELTVLEQAKPKVTFANPFGNNLAEDTNAISALSGAAMKGVIDLLPAIYDPLDGFPSGLQASIAQADMNCSMLINGASKPAILNCYSYSNTAEGPYIVANCSNGSQTTYSKFYYKNSTAARNVMGVLVGSEVSYTSGRLTATPYTTTGGYRDDFYLKSKSTMMVNNKAVFCGGQLSCPQSYKNGVGAEGNNYVLTYFNYDSDNTFYESLNSKGGILSAALAITDYVPDINGRKYTYLLGFVFNANPLINQYQFSCLTADCTILGDQQTVQFKNGTKPDGTGPAVNMSKPAENTFNIQIN